MSRKFRIAVIGIGGIAGMHAKAIGDIANAQLVGGSCRGEEKGQAFAKDYGCRWYGDYLEMLDREKPDVVTVCTPSGAHLEPVLACAERGIDVLCEKPLEITTARVDLMMAAAQAGGITLGCIFPQRFNPVLEELYRAAAAGRFGKLAVVNAYVPWWRDDAYYAPGRWQGTLAMDGGGALMNQSIHGVDAVQWLAGARQGLSGGPTNPVAEVFAFTAKRGHAEDLIEVEDTAVAVLRFGDGSLGQVLGATSMYPGNLKRVQIAGAGGTAEVLEDELVTWTFAAEEAEDDQRRTRFGRATSTGGGAGDPMAIDYANHTRNIRSFLDALEKGQEPVINALEGRKAVAIIQGIYESAKTGRAVKI